MRNYGYGKRISSLFFTRENNESTMYVCKCGTRLRRTGTSYSNLVSHIRTAHPECISLMHPDSTVTQKRIHEFFSTSKAGNLYGWFDLIITGLLPFYYTESALFRLNIKHGAISLKKFTRYLPRLVELVEKKVAHQIPDKFALVFDGWSCNLRHYLAIYVSYSDNSANGFQQKLLKWPPLDNESCLDADEHIQILTYILKVYGKSWHNVFCVIGDNVAVNKTISTKLKIPLVGCASHRLNLAVKSVLPGEMEVTMKSSALMSK